MKEKIMNALNLFFRLLIFVIINILFLPIHFLKRSDLKNKLINFNNNFFPENDIFFEIIKRKKMLYTIIAYVVVIGAYLLFFPLIYERLVVDTNLIQSEEFIRNITVENQDVFVDGDAPATLNQANLLFNEKFIAIVEIPAINLFQGIVQTRDAAATTVHRNVSFMRETDLPTVQGGNFALAAHSGRGNTAFFDKTDRLKPGDFIYIHKQDTVFTYEVVRTHIVHETEVSVLNRPRDGQNIITLITCVRNNDRKRVITVGRLLNTV